MSLRAGIVIFPGTNRERDMAIALGRASGGRSKPNSVFSRASVAASSPCAPR